jgi:hypothetical protein
MRASTPTICEDKNTMVSLFGKQKTPGCGLLSLRTSCVLPTSSDDLEHKREIQLAWMRENGVRYLGDAAKPVERRSVKAAEKRAQPRDDAATALDAAPARLLELVKQRTNAA